MDSSFRFRGGKAQDREREGRKNGTKSGEHLGLALHRQGVFDVGTARRNA